MVVVKLLPLGCVLMAVSCPAQKRAQKITIPVAPPVTAVSHDFHDGHFGVKFEVPPGWSLSRKDGQVSTFHEDARSASPKAKVRGVVSLDFNPFPYSTLSGAVFYFSVEPHAKEPECASEATPPGLPATVRDYPTDMQDIDGMKFTHGHDEHGEICVEARDEVYTAYRKGSCYRFDMAINTFCGVSSGRMDVTDAQVRSLNQRMADILSTVDLKWTKGGAHPVPVPEPPSLVKQPQPKTAPVEAKKAMTASR